jgi:predicted outer membrane repeat protein
MLTPICFAVLRLTTSAIFIGCSAGKISGLGELATGFSVTQNSSAQGGALAARVDSMRRQSRQVKKHFLRENICKPKLISPAQECSCSLPLAYPTLPE